MTAIGFIGLGKMGAPMAANLVKAGHHVTGFDISAAALGAVADAGVTAAESVTKAAADRDVVITMLPAGEHVIEAYCGGDGILAAVRPGTLLVDSSTIDMEAAKRFHSAAAEAGFAALDAPVSGGVAGAAAASLTFMVGGEEEAFRRGKPLLEAMGKRIVHCGPAGSGQAAKICNNMILGISMIGVAEASVLAERLGLSHQALFDVASNSSGQCWSLTSYCPVPGPVPASPANRGYQPGFSAALMLKDLKLSQAAAQNAAAPTPLGAAATQLYALQRRRALGTRFLRHHRMAARLGRDGLSMEAWGASSPPHGIGLHQPRRGGGAEQAVRAARSRDQAADRPGRRDLEVVAAPAQIRQHLRPEALFGQQVPRSTFARIERAREMRRMRHRHVDRLLQVEAMMHVPQEEQELPLLLLVAARRAEGQRRPALSKSQRRGQGGARPLAGREARGQALARARTSARASSARSRAPGMPGEDCSQPPDGVAATMLPQRSIDIDVDRVAASRRQHAAMRRLARRRAPVELADSASSAAPTRSTCASKPGTHARPKVARGGGADAARGARRCRRRRAASRPARRRNPDRRNRPRGRRRRASSPRSRVWMKSALAGPMAARSMPSRSASVCRKTGPWPQGPVLATVQP